jgi:hypothetical protein
MPVTWIRELESFYEGLVPGDQAVMSGRFLVRARSISSRDLISPLGLYQAGLADADQLVLQCLG